MRLAEIKRTDFYEKAERILLSMGLYFQVEINPYIKVTGCRYDNVFFCVFLSRKIWLSSEPIWFSFIVKLFIGPGRFITILGNGNCKERINTSPPPLKKKKKFYLKLKLKVDRFCLMLKVSENVGRNNCTIQGSFNIFYVALFSL